MAPQAGYSIYASVEKTWECARNAQMRRDLNAEWTDIDKLIWVSYLVIIIIITNCADLASSWSSADFDVTALRPIRTI